MHEQNRIGGHKKGSMAIRRMRGYSLLEMLAVVAILMIASAFTIMGIQPALKQSTVTNAYNTTLMRIRQARELAISQRRTYIVRFDSAATPNTITITPASVTPGGTTVVATLPQQVTFHVEPGTPSGAGATPDGFGSGVVAIDFDQGVTGAGASDKTSIYFQPDGSAQDVNSNLNNGVIYMAQTGDLYSSRAITVWGATGRLRGWRLYLSGGSPVWRQQ
jgi:prepilin-type N-terminal cleavage/methylation domain-containing protein